MKILRGLVLFLFAFVSLNGLAMTKSAPLPSSVAKASSVYLVNHTGNQKVLDTAYEEFSNWKRFKVAESRESADLIVTFDTVERFVKGTTRLEVKMTVTSPGSEDPLFQTTPMPTFDTSNQASRTKDCIHDFEKRLAAQQ